MSEKELMINEIHSLYDAIKRKEFGFLLRLNRCEKGLYLDEDKFKKNFIKKFELIAPVDEKTHHKCILVAEKLCELNSYVRKETYLNYCNMTEDELLINKNNDIKKYYEIINRMMRFENIGKNYPNSSFNDIYNTISKYDYICENDDIPYDIIYATIKRILDESSYLYQNFYDDMINLCINKILELQNMNNYDYRNYKISLLQLNNNELRMFNEIKVYKK